MAYKKIEQYEDEITNGLIKSYGEVLGLLGEDPEREGLKKTPERLAKAITLILSSVTSVGMLAIFYATIPRSFHPALFHFLICSKSQRQYFLL